MWLVDPVDAPEAMERAAALGEPAGVLQLFVAHARDGEAIAKRLGVPFHVLPDVLPDSPFSVLNLDLGPWKERALWWPEPRGLVVAESIGTATHYARRPRPGRRALDAPPAPADRAEAVPARAPARRSRRRRSTAATPPRRCSTRSTARDATSRRSFWKAPGLIRSMQGRR